MGGALIVLFAIDLEHHLLPDAITLPGIVLGLLASIVLPPGIVEDLQPGTRVRLSGAVETDGASAPTSGCASSQRTPLINASASSSTSGFSTRW